MKRLSTDPTVRLAILSHFCLIAIAVLFWAKPYLASSAISDTDATAEQAVSKLTRANAVTVRATKRNNPWLKLQDGRGLRAQYRAAGAERAAAEQALKLGQAEPVALASGDLNGDSYPDLVSGYAGAEGGIVTLHLGNPEAFSPQKQETIRAITDGQFPDPFLPNATALRAPAAADFVGVGDFDRDGKLDVITAARGGKELYLFAGDGSGALRAAQMVSLPGSVTAMTTGDVNQTDGKADVAVGIVGNQGAAVLVYAGAKGVHATQPAVYPLAAQATQLAVGRLDDDAAEDLAAVAGGAVVILHGQAQASGFEEGFEEVLGRVETVRLPFAVQSLALGEFIWDREARQEIAALAADGSVHIVARGTLDTRPFSTDEMQARRRQLAATRAAMENGSAPRPARLAKALRWQVVEDLPASASLKSGDLSRAALVGARISSQPADDLLLMDAAGRKLQVLTKASPKEAGASAAREAIEFEAESAPMAVLPMRLNVLGVSSLAVLRAGSVAPTAIMAAPLASFVVTKTADTNDGTCDADCSLREAIVASNANGVGADTITFTANTPTLTITSGGSFENAAATGDLDIEGSLTVMGGGSGTTIISTTYTSACGDCKVFGINQTGANTGLSVNFSGVTIQNGFNNGAGFVGTFFETGGGVDFFLIGTGNSHSMSNSVVNNNTVTGSPLSHGGGVNVDSFNEATPGGASAGSVTFTSVSFTNNTSSTFGGGVALGADKHDVTMTNPIVTGNTAQTADGGGIRIRHSFGGTVSISGASGQVSNNSGTQGGGISNPGNQVTNINDITISNNTATGTGGSSLGGGIDISQLGALNVAGGTTLTNVTISGNQANNGPDAAGGGVAFGQNYATTLTNCTISGNSSKIGGGVLNQGSNATPAEVLTITGGSIRGNTVTGDGVTTGFGGAFAARGTGSPSSSVTTFTNVAIGGTGAGQGNSAVNGGAIANLNTSSTTVGGTSSSILGNTATTNGGGVYVTGGTATMSNLTVTNNSASSGGAFFISGGTLNVSLSRIHNNTAATGSGITQTGGTATVENNWWGCDDFPNAAGCQTGSGTFDADPRIDLKVTASPTSVAFGGISTVTASFATNSDNAAINPFVMNGLPVTFSATNGTMLPPMSTIVGLMATSIYTNTGCGDAMVSATVDNGTQSATITFIKASSTTIITSDTPDPSVTGQGYVVSFSVIGVGPAPSGTVTVSDGTNSCMGTLSGGTGSCTLTSITAGAKTLVATYAGDACFNGSTSAGEPHQVDKANTTTTITGDTPDPSAVGQAVAITYSVTVNSPGSGTPTGNVTVTASTGETCTGTVAAGTCSITFTTAGTRTLTASYAGDANYNGSTSAAENHTVNKIDTTTTITSDLPDPSVVGQSVTVNYTVTASAGTPTGNVVVTVSGGSETCTGTVAAGSCTITLTAAGARTLTATYAGDTNFNGSSDTEAHQVNPASTTTTITSDLPDPSLVGQAVTVNYTVTANAPGAGTPTGNVVVTVSGGSETCTGSVAAGSCTITLTAAGARTLTATYAGDGNFAGSSDTEAHQVDKADTTTTITSDMPDPSTVGQAVTVNYTVTVNAPGSGTPTGNVTVSDGVDSCTGTVASGSCTLTLTTQGARTLTATYAGDANFSGSSDTEPHQVNPECSLDSLIAQVQALVPPLNQNQANGLIEKLQDAKTSLNQGNTTAACNQIKAFINQANAFINNGTLTAAQGQPLIDCANQIRAEIPCGGSSLAKTVGLRRQFSGEFHLKNRNETGLADLVLSYGQPGDWPVAGDWDGDGIDTIGVYRDGVFYLRTSQPKSELLGARTELTIEFGQRGDLPVVGDWDGDGVTTIGVYRHGVFLLRNSNTPGLPEITINFGLTGDLPLAGDWDGDGTFTIGVYSPATGIFQLRNALADGAADVVVFWGGPDFLPVVGDWDGDGVTTIGLYSLHGEFFLRNANTVALPETRFTLGIAGGIPIAGTWNKTPGVKGLPSR